MDSRETCQKMLGFGQDFTPNVAERVEHYQGERPLFDLYGVEDEIEKALARRVELKIGRLPRHRPDRGAHHHRRQHRRLRRRAQLRRHHLQDQPRGGAGDRAPAAAAEHRRHHHHRLHRHGPEAPETRLNEFRKALARDRSVARDRRFTQLGLVGDDAQAHARVARPGAVRAVPGLRRPRAAEDRADRVLPDPARADCARRGSSARASSASSPRSR